MSQIENIKGNISNYIFNEIKIVRITEEYEEEAVELFTENFPKNENLSIATNLPSNPNALAEIETLFRKILKDGISFAAKHKETGCLVAICANKVIAPKSNLSLDEIFQTFKTPEMSFIGKILHQLESSFDIAKEFKIDSYVEIVFLSTKREFERKGIARSLTEHTINFVRDYGRGMEDLPQHIREEKPQAVCSVFSTKFTQIIGQKLGFQSVGQVQFKDVHYNGYTFSDKLNSIHDCAIFAVKKP